MSLPYGHYFDSSSVAYYKILSSIKKILSVKLLRNNIYIYCEGALQINQNRKVIAFLLNTVIRDRAPMVRGPY